TAIPWTSPSQSTTPSSCRKAKKSSRTAPSSSRSTPSTTGFRSRRRATRESARRAACQHHRAARSCVIASRVGSIAHLPLCYASLAREESGPKIKPFAYIRISDRFSITLDKGAQKVKSLPLLRPFPCTLRGASDLAPGVLPKEEPIGPNHMPPLVITQRQAEDILQGGLDLLQGPSSLSYIMRFRGKEVFYGGPVSRCPMR